MDRRRFLHSLAALGVAVPAAALSPRAARATVDRALGSIARTPWWVPVLRAWAEGAPSPALDTFSDALDVPTGTEPTRIDVAVARLLVGGIQDALPAWTGSVDGGIVSARPTFPSRLDGTRVFEPVHVGTIDWARSAPGYSWPEAYLLVAVPELGLQVLVASRDSDDALGCTDHAVGWRPLSMSAREAACDLLRQDWAWRIDAWDQEAWEALDAPGLLDEADLLALRETVWPSRDADEEEDEEDEEDDGAPPRG